MPVDVELPQDAQNAREAARKILRDRPKSIERDSVLSALGRIGKSGLKCKIRHRAKFVIDKTGDYFQERLIVCVEAGDTQKIHKVAWLWVPYSAYQLRLLPCKYYLFLFAPQLSRR
jgi:hypothetical protein